MLEKLRYINHINETLDFGTDKLFVNENDLRDFEWSVTSINDKISGFKKGIVTKAIPIIIKCNSVSEGTEIRNKLFEVFEKDVRAKKHGKFIIGDYYLKCFVTGSKKAEYLISKSYMELTLTVQADYPEWIKETTTAFRGNSSGGDAYLDYSFDYPFDYKNGLEIKNINNTDFVASNFRIVIYGKAENPAIFIGGHEYSVEVDIGQGEFLTIDSIEKTVILTRNNGEKVNCFNLRNKNSYIFEKIPPGNSFVTTSTEGLLFDITLLEERSEPKWT